MLQVRVPFVFALIHFPKRMRAGQEENGPVHIVPVLVLVS